MTEATSRPADNTRHPRWPLVLVAAVILAGLIGGGFLWWRHTRSPQYSLSAARRAMGNHDWFAFQRYVDVDGVSQSLAGSLDGGGADLFVKDGLKESVEGKKASMRQYAAFADYLSDFETAKIDRITRIDGRVLVRVSAGKQRLDLKMRRTGDHWQVVSVENAAEVAADITRMRERAEKEARRNARPLEIVESGYTVVESEFTSPAVIFGLVVKNQNKDLGLEIPRVRVEMRSAEGQSLGTVRQPMTRIMPGETIGFAGEAFPESGTPSSAQFTIEPPSQDQWQFGDDLELGPFRPFKVTDVKGGPTGVFTGDVENPNPVPYDEEMITVSVLLRDESGKLVGGYATYVVGLPPRTAVPFETFSLEDMEQEPIPYSRVEGYAEVMPGAPALPGE